ncbi:hypothetical protein JN11_00739 [Mucilaginibacter frigoritolerans]|uniref:Uncharacterized protein n=1 Tax=Mucilaginibacter frigoritolerans TaxID=652788 RepID=A0A562UBP9_9SPHI|nr:hypothetical protein [Mucilaginibacter frigoritolerans]TWJ03202.1 hypothetical protein JN11_00739 [Mucilaginibacter frigoritolerans]
MAAKKSFKGQSEVSIEDAIKNAIGSDPRGDQGTDEFNYDVAHLKVIWGGFAQTTTYKVILERP